MRWAHDATHNDENERSAACAALHNGTVQILLTMQFMKLDVALPQDFEVGHFPQPCPMAPSPQTIGTLHGSIYVKDNTLWDNTILTC